MNNEKAPAPECRGQCLFGKCPFERCIRARKASGGPSAAAQKAGMEILTSAGALPRGDRRGLGIAVDIGTTTIAAALYDLDAGRPLAVQSCVNGQYRYGLDVLSRIQYSTAEPDGLAALKQTVVSDLNALTDGLCAAALCAPEDVACACVTGNTTMLCLLTGISPASMGVSPFTAPSLFGEWRTGADLGLCVKNADVYLADCISSFVGGDISCAVLRSSMLEKGKKSLLLDIGTNGEVVLFDGSALLVTSTAAGPAFEGATISCGSAAVAGAASHAYLAGGKFHFSVIGGGEPQSLCGSALIDAASILLEAGILDESGRLTSGAAASEYRLSEKIAITQKDVRELQTAKAAVAAGVRTLLHEGGVGFGELDAVYLAGGFGNYMDAESAVRIGLLPASLAGRIVPVGNAAMGGAALILADSENERACARIARMGAHVELGSNPYFMEQYIDCMMLGPAD